MILFALYTSEDDLAVAVNKSLLKRKNPGYSVCLVNVVLILGGKQIIP